MTSPDAPVPATTPVSVADAGELVAATPVLLGFTPRSSLVAMALGGASGVRLGLTLRIDLPPPEYVDGAAESVVRGILLDDPAAVVVLVVAPGGDAGPPAVELVERVVSDFEARGVDVPIALWTPSTESGSRWCCYDACACTGVVPRPEETPLVVAALAEGRVVRSDRTDLHRLVAPADLERIRRREAKLVAEIDAEIDAEVAAEAQTETETEVADGCGPAAGVAAAAGTPVASTPVASTPVASTAVASTAVASTASATTTAVASTTAACATVTSDSSAAVAAVAAARAVSADTDPAAAAHAAATGLAADRPGSGRGRRPTPGEDVVAGIAALDAAVDAAALALAAEGPGGAGADEAWLDDERVLALVRALRLPVVRDAAIASCTGSRPAAAEALWAALARETPDPEAAEPAALLALSALLRGDGALANVALDRAEAAWPAHRLTAILRGLAQAGARPDELRACLAGGLQPPNAARMRR